MTVKTGQAWAGTFVTLDATGALATPGTGPAGVLYVDGTANGASVTITGSNPYKWAVTLPSLTAGQRVDMYITATISTIATASVVASEQADTALVSEVKTDTAAILADTGTDGVLIASGAITAAVIATDAIDADAIKADAITEIQNGLATAAALDTVDNFLDTEIAAILADTNELQTDLVNGGRIDRLIDGIKAKTDLITTGTTVTIASAVSGSTITAIRGDSLSAALEDIGSLVGYSKVYFTVKGDKADADTSAIIQIEKTAGLKYINGAAATTSANGSITISDEATGDITVALDEAETAKLSPGGYQYDVQVVRTAGTVSTLTEGTFNVSADVTRAVT